jgi:hypothetical protein
MAHQEPFDQLTGPLQVYVAAHGTAEPSIDSTPSGSWVELAETDGEQAIQHMGRLTYFRDNAHQGPRKAVRPEEDVVFTFTLVSLTLEHYARVLDDVSDMVEDTSGDPDIKKIPMERGFEPNEYALLFRGEAASPYGAWPGQYYIPLAVFDDEPQPTFGKDGRPALECEVHALADTDQSAGYELGWLTVQSAATGAS